MEGMCRIGSWRCRRFFNDMDVDCYVIVEIFVMGDEGVFLIIFKIDIFGFGGI